MESLKDSVRQTVRIEDVIGSYVPLVLFGKNYKARCPFHQEKTPSFNVNSEKQMFYCFGCKKGGDVFSFIQEIEHLDFKQALAFLAEKAGIDIQQSKEISQELIKKKKLLEIHEYTTRFYQLILSKNSAVIDYLKNRGLQPETIKQWRIGYAPDGFGNLVSVLRKKGFSDQDLVDSGLIIRGERGLFDRFHGRVMFPITDPQGKIIAFSGRVFPGSHESERPNAGKYVNSPETVLYQKSKALFGFSFAKQSMTQKKAAIVVEGQFDVVLAHQIGDTNTIALSGTACTDDHIKQLARFATEIIIATDADQAGIQSAHHIAQLGFEHDCDIALLLLPEKMDPADVMVKDKDQWQQLKQSKQDYIAFFSAMTDGQPLRERIELLGQHIFPVLAGMINHVYRDGKIRQIAHAFHVSQDSVRNEFAKFLDTQKKYITPTGEPTIVQQIREPLDVQHAELAFIYETFMTETKDWFAGHPDAVAIASQHISSLSQEYRARQIHNYQTLDSPAWTIRLDTLWIRIQQLAIEKNMERIKSTITQSQDPHTTLELQQELLALKTRREQLVQSLIE